MRARTRRLLFLATIAVVLSAALLWAFRPDAVLVDLAPLARGAVTVSIAEEGRTRVRDVFVVSAPVAGRLQRVTRRAGDAVTAGETELAVLEAATPGFLDARARAQAEAALKAAEAARDLAAAELEKARAELAFAEIEAQRVGKLASTDVASKRALDIAAVELRTRKAAVATAEAALRLRHHEVETARAQLMDPAAAGSAGTCITLRAPVTGTVLRLLQESEAVVAAGTPLIEIGDPGDIEIVAEMLTSDAVRLPPAARVVVEGWGGAAPLTGRVRRVEPSGFAKISALGVEERRVLVLADFTSPREQYERLGHGFRLDLRFVLSQVQGVATVPVGALFRQGDDWAVFAVEDGVARRRIVSVGLIDEAAAEIRSGLAEGQPVVVHPSDRVENGVRVTPRRPPRP